MLDILDATNKSASDFINEGSDYFHGRLKPVFEVIRPNDKVFVAIMKCEADNKYHFVNLTKWHICKCGFERVADAIMDMNCLIRDGKIISYSIVSSTDENENEKDR